MISQSDRQIADRRRPLRDPAPLDLVTGAVELPADGRPRCAVPLDDTVEDLGADGLETAARLERAPCAPVGTANNRRCRGCAAPSPSWALPPSARAALSASARPATGWHATCKPVWESCATLQRYSKRCRTKPGLKSSPFWTSSRSSASVTFSISWRSRNPRLLGTFDIWSRQDCSRIAGTERGYIIGLSRIRRLSMVRPWGSCVRCCGSESHLISTA